MASVVSLFLTVALWTTLVAAAAASQINIIAFGDSLSDTGIVYKATGGKVPSAPYYWMGRFTNEQGNWQDWINSVNRPGIHATNRAIGGARACRRFNLTEHFIPTIGEQAAAFVHEAFEDPSLLTNGIPVPVIWAGHRDVWEMHDLSLHELARLPLDMAECVVHTAMLLLAARVPYVVVGTLAPLALSPQGNGNWFTSSTVWHTNEYIKKGVSDLQAELSKQGRNQSVLLWDTHEFMMQAVRNYKSLGFTYSSSSSCLTYQSGGDVYFGVPPMAKCFKPNDYMYYDGTHPTSKFHQLIGEDLLKTLERAGVSLTAPTALLYRDRMLRQQQQRRAGLRLRLQNP